MILGKVLEGSPVFDPDKENKVPTQNILFSFFFFAIHQKYKEKNKKDQS